MPVSVGSADRGRSCAWRYIACPNGSVCWSIHFLAHIGNPLTYRFVDKLKLGHQMLRAHMSAHHIEATRNKKVRNECFAFAFHA